MKRILPAVLFATASALASAAPTAAPVRAEIDALLARLEASNCQFHRNGSWHGAADASKHLLRKLEYIERRGTIQSTEQFIELAAARSSASGRAYLVKCGSEPPVESQAWLTRQLGTIRAPSSNRAKP
jgi:hypothetical protein